MVCLAFFTGAGVFGLRVRDSAVGKGSKSDGRASAAFLFLLVAGGREGSGTESYFVVELDTCVDWAAFGLSGAGSAVLIPKAALVPDGALLLWFGLATSA